MPEKLTDKVDFDIIRYANCWEDADILLKGLDAGPGSKILSVGSAGDNSFSLLTTNPEYVVAVDVNVIQLYLIELKKIAIIRLEYDELIAFLGFRLSLVRKETFNSLKSELSIEARRYFEHNISLIEDGIVDQGKFEKYFQLFAEKVIPFIHRRSTTEKLLAPKTEAEQEQFYDKKWNTWRWRLLFQIFFSRTVMGRLGRDPEFLKEVDLNVSKNIFRMAELELKSVAAQQNFILRYNLTGTFGNLLPHYLKYENYVEIKKNIDKLHIKQGFAEDAISEFGKFKYMNLSNIFEYMNVALFSNTSKALVDGLEKNGRIAYWNLMVHRKLSDIMPDELTYLKDLSEHLTIRDKGFFYKHFYLDQVK